MDPAELYSDYLQNRFKDVLETSARQRQLPTLRQRLAFRLQHFALWLEPNLSALTNRQKPVDMHERVTS